MMNPLASWDLSAGFNATLDYSWQDRNDAYVKNNTYIFQVCSNTLVMPPVSGQQASYGGGGDVSVLWK